MKKILVVGAGLAGATAARMLAEAGHFVIVIDERDHIGGNAYDVMTSEGVRIHVYGPHIFHTKNEKVWNFVNTHARFVKYQHRVQALLTSGKYVPFPPNKVTKSFVPHEKIVDTFYRPYTFKMWGVPLEEVSPNILARVPGRDDYVDLYFPNDPYQGMPVNGYAALVGNILNHANIQSFCKVKFDHNSLSSFDHIFYSGSIDRFYDYSLGILDYRCIDFEAQEIAGFSKILPVTTVNFTDPSVPYTRVTDWNHFPNSHGKNSTWLTYETPRAARPKVAGDMYYPVQNERNKNLYQDYRKMHKEKNTNVTFIGRCGQYVYLDMDQAINSTMAAVERYLAE